MICKPQRSCGYVADLGFYYWWEAGKKQMFIKGSLCQAFSWCRWEKNASERWNSQQVKHVTESACKHLFKYLNPPTILPTSWKTVSCVACIWGTYSKWLLQSAGQSQMIGVCVEENSHNWPIIGLRAGILEWGIENNACRLHKTISPQLPHVFAQSFFTCFLHYLGAWKRLNNRMENTNKFWIPDRKITTHSICFSCCRVWARIWSLGDNLSPWLKFWGTFSFLGGQKFVHPSFLARPLIGLGRKRQISRDF